MPLNNDPITYLGVTLSNHHNNFFKLKHLPKLSRLKNVVQTCNAWSDYSFTKPAPGNYGKEIVLINSFIKLNNKLVYHKKFIECNVYRVKDFVNLDGRPLPFDVFARKFETNPFQFATYFGIVNAIPIAWRQAPSIANYVCHLNFAKSKGIFSIVFSIDLLGLTVTLTKLA